MPETPTPSTVLVTGAATGFGRGIVEDLLERGHRVLAGVLDDQQANTLRAELGDAAGIEVVPLDLTDGAQIAAVAEREIDVLVNNAGFGSQGPIESTAMERVRRAFEVNVFGTLDLTQRVLAGMRSRGRGGRIVVVSSVAGLFVGPGAGAYTMSKHALDAMAVELQAELAGTDISVHIVNPGPHQTGFNEQLVANAPSSPEEHQRLLGNQADPSEPITVLADLAAGTRNDARVIIPRRFADVAAEAFAAKIAP